MKKLKLWKKEESVQIEVKELFNIKLLCSRDTDKVSLKSVDLHILYLCTGLLLLYSNIDDELKAKLALLTTHCN